MPFVFSGGESKTVRQVHQITCSANLGVAGAALLILMLETSGPIGPLVKMDFAISEYLGLIPPQADYVQGYFAFAVPALAIFLCAWLALRSAGRTKLGRAFLDSWAGLTALAATPAVHLFLPWAYFRLGEGFAIGELLVVCGLWALVARGAFALSQKLVFWAILLHFAYWFWEFGLFSYFNPYEGPFAPMVGLLASLVWFEYRRRLGCEALAKMRGLG